MDFDNDNILDFNEFKNNKVEEELMEEFENDSFFLAQAYNIKRNDPCPCGSGKKFKNCCAEVEPNKSADYYYDKISDLLEDKNSLEEIDDLKIAYQIAQKADQDYPIDPLFSEIAGTLAVELGDFKKAKNYLLKTYRILKDDFNLNSTYALFEALAELNEYEKIEEVGEKLLDQFDDYTFYLFLTETKFMLGKREEGYKYGLKAYEKSDNDIYILNTLIKIYIGNNLYIEALKLLKNNYSRFSELDQKLNRAEDNVLDIFEYTVEDLFDISTEGSYSEEKYIKYLDKLIKIFENIDPENRIKENEIKNIESLIPDRYTFPLFMVSLFYNFENYEWISKNSDILFKKTDQKEKNFLIDLVLNAHFQAANYKKVIEYEDYIFSKKLLNEKEDHTISTIQKNYFLSLFYLNKKKKIIDFLLMLDNTYTQDTFYMILNLISQESKIEIINILEYLKNLEDFDLVDNIKIIHEQLRLMVNDLHLIDYPKFNQKELNLIDKFLKEIKKYDADNFVYHYAKWLINKSKEKAYEVPIDVILNKPITYPSAIALNYFATIKILGPKYVLRDSASIKKQIPAERIEFFETIAKIKSGEIKNLRKVLTKFPDQADNIMGILQELLTEEELDNLISYSY